MEKDIYINLIYKRLAGDISQSEQTQLEGWLASSEENRQTLADLSTVWEATAEISPQVSVDLDQEFALLNTKIQREEKAAKAAAVVRELPARPRNSNRRIWLLAASLLFLATALFLNKDFFQSNASALVEVNSGDQIKVLQLPDGSTVFLNKNSTLSYPERFKNNERNMQLKGEGFFEVVSDKRRPFKVQFSNSTVEVLGTSFNINAQDELQVVQVKTGIVKWVNAQKNQVLKAGMTATLNSSTGELSKFTGNRMNADYWRDKQLRFDEVAINYVLLELERLFEVQFTAPANSLINCQFTASFDDPSLDEILETLATVFDAEVVKIDSKNYQLNGGGCQ